VEVAVTVEAAEIVREYGAVEVQVKNGVGEYSINPKSVYLRLIGPGDELEKLELTAGQVFLDLNGLAPGEHALAPSFNLPAEIKVLEYKPQRFKVRIGKVKK
jgi:hypothetical protein